MDKQGGIRRAENTFIPFRNFISEMGMGEIQFRGRRWTWANNRKGEGFIEERLDMFFGSPEWMVNFDNAVVQHILNQASDHSILLLDSKPHMVRRKSRFIFDSRWCNLEGCTAAIMKAWNQEVGGSRMFSFNKKLKMCRQGVLEWRKKENLNSKSQIQQLKKQMEVLQENGGKRDWNLWYNLKFQLEKAYQAEEEFWARKARKDWLAQGDKTQNTSMHQLLKEGKPT